MSRPCKILTRFATLHVWHVNDVPVLAIDTLTFEVEARGLLHS